MSQESLLLWLCLKQRSYREYRTSANIVFQKSQTWISPRNIWKTYAQLILTPRHYPRRILPLPLNSIITRQNECKCIYGQYFHQFSYASWSTFLFYWSRFLVNNVKAKLNFNVINQSICLLFPGTSSKYNIQAVNFFIIVDKHVQLCQCHCQIRKTKGPQKGQ